MRDLIDTSSLNPTEKVQFSGEGLEVKDLCKKISKVTIGTKKNPRLLPKQDQNKNAIAYEWLLNRISRPENSTVDNPKSKLLVLQAYRFLKSQLASEYNKLETIADLNSMMSFADHILDGVVFNLTTVKDMAQGYRIFSSENTTGLKLNHMDITRALMIAQLDRKKLRDAEKKVRGSLARMSKNMDVFGTHLYVRRHCCPDACRRQELCNRGSRMEGNHDWRMHRLARACRHGARSHA